MKRTNIFYWVFTALLAAAMLFSAIPNIMVNQASVDLVSKQLGYPQYFIPFIGVAKLLGVIAILIPGMPRIKEWAYAGMAYDLIAATYSALSIGESVAKVSPMLIFFLLLAGSYYFYHKRMQAKKTATSTLK